MLDRLLVVDRCIGVYEGNSGTLSQYLFCPIFGMYFYLFTCFYLCSHGNRKLIGIENIVGGGWITQYFGCEEASNFMHLIKCWISKWQSELYYYT